LDRVVIASAEAIDLPFQESFFDCVIYGDVLEHLLDPWAAIRRHTSLSNLVEQLLLASQMYNIGGLY
jgi:2-polyprenyl-3-methyl-5-hydroxy-6-metoxy-1,4-benzoquinol methylase